LAISTGKTDKEMIAPLRKRHRITWLFLSVFLPLLMVLSYVNIPERKYSKNEALSLEQNLKVISEKTFDGITAQITRSDNNEAYLVLLFEERIKTAYGNIYFGMPDKMNLVGTLGSSKRQVFQLNKDLIDQKRLIIKDEIENNIIIELELE
jgi:hypothetical protein